MLVLHGMTNAFIEVILSVWVVLNGVEYNVSCYDQCTFYLNVWNRYGTHEQGDTFVKKMIHTLKSNGAFFAWDTQITVTTDLTNIMSIYDGTNCDIVTIENYGK